MKKLILLLIFAPQMLWAAAGWGYSSEGALSYLILALGLFLLFLIPAGIQFLYQRMKAGFIRFSQQDASPESESFFEED
ncbi:MAG: hypothetical protein H6581_06705 [Bacteroidia bacterium]|nr:hypothetical protein [Bacteroidia bacterium]